MGLVGHNAPDFDCKAVVDGGQVKENFSLGQFRGKYTVLFFYPLDFTFVCPTELHAFQEKLAEFEKRNTQLVACSVDSWFSHAAWLNTPKKQGGIQGVTYPIVSDFNKEISRLYGVLNEELGASYRGLFLIDKDGVVRHELVNDLPLGRNVDEVLRMIDALQFHEKNGEVCPANWQEGEQAMTADEDGLKVYFNSEEKTVRVN
ncbi:thioredoxin peroxidase [Candidatus Marinamargulisbacteria bacterium SCGC AG-439-L15]|nr:thioredoxin peroxidase [Candidatus Marinamargulisbacteria bacterium SCGC AG-439-L15]